MVSRQGFGMKQVMAYLKVLSWHSPGATEQNHKTAQAI